MNESHFLFKAILAVIGLVLVGSIVIALAGFLIHVFLYLAIGALVVGGVMMLYGKAKRSLTNGGYRRRIGGR